MSDIRGVTYDDSKALGYRTPAYFQADMDARYAAPTGTRSPEAYGAIGDGSSSDQDAMEEWFADWIAGEFTYGLLTPGKNYVLTDELVVDSPVSSRTILGRGGRITQTTNGKGHIDFRVENCHHLKFLDMELAWGSQQTLAHGSVGFAFDNGGTNTYLGWYNLVFKDIRFLNAHRGIRTRPTAGHFNGIWHSTFDNVWSDYGSTGSVIDIGSGLVGQPSLRILGCYQQRQVSTQPVVRVVLSDNLIIDGLEVNGEEQSAHDSIHLEACTSVRVNARAERGSLADGEAIVTLRECRDVDIQLAVQATQGFTGTRQAVVNCLTGDYDGATGTHGVRVSGAFTTYGDNPAAPASFHTAYVDDTSSPLLEDNFVKSGSMGGAIPTGKAPATGGGIADFSITPAKLIKGSSTADGTKAYFGDGTWKVPSGGSGGSGGVNPFGIRLGTVMFLGDSASAVMSPYNTSTFVDTHLGASGGHLPNDWAFWANILEGGVLDILGSAATVGYAVAQIRDQHLPTILAAKPEYCIINTLGGNDMMASGAFTSAIFDAAITIIETLVNAGIKPVLCTLFPINKPDLSRQEMARYNTFIYRAARKYDLDVIDFYKALSDKATGYYKTGFSDDNVHPNAIGSAAQVAEARKWFAKRGGVVSWDGLLAPVNDALTGQYANPLLPGTLGANAPTGFSGSGVAHNLAASSLYPGNEYSIVATGAGLGYTAAGTLAGTPGQDWEWVVRVKSEPALTSGVVTGGWGMFMYDQNGQFALNIGVTNAPNPNFVTMDKPIPIRGKFPAGVTTLQPIFYVVGTGSKVTIAQNTFRNVQALGAPGLTP